MYTELEGHKQGRIIHEAMTNEQFELACKEPVDLEACHKALQQFINREATLSIPARPNDPDMLIIRAISELKLLRRENQELHRKLIDQRRTMSGMRKKVEG